MSASRALVGEFKDLDAKIYDQLITDCCGHPATLIQLREILVSESKSKSKQLSYKSIAIAMLDKTPATTSNVIELAIEGKPVSSADNQLLEFGAFINTPTNLDTIHYTYAYTMIPKLTFFSIVALPVNYPAIAHQGSLPHIKNG